MFAHPHCTAVILPGTGSDDVFVRSVFTRPLAALGIDVIAPAPPPGTQVVTGYLHLLDRIADVAGTELLVGGVSLGSHLATEWALRNQDRCQGVLAALPAWHGAPDRAPAAVVAKASADLVTRHGVEAALSTSTAAVPAWLATELGRAWRRHGSGLSGNLRTGAAHPAPSLTRLPTLHLPVGIAACEDDPVHPLTVARAWAAALPQAVLYRTTLTAVGTDPETLGRASVLAWLRARWPDDADAADGKGEESEGSRNAGDTGDNTDE